ncbi:hypothetical protein BOX15_Mlig033223g1 [Macrostomum lignano]|uniref:Phosphodiesterase n=2 Tax=Macrostomum lignano TaxID=282301 RepID=A0A267GDA4_9PLAT|nr:hypothetical protein BOX15_Mlig033223g1 [Macrostomum lignano]
MAAACCGLVRRRRNGNSKYQQQPLPHVGSQQPATNDFSRLHTVLCLTELQTAATEILADILPCRDIRFHYNEESPIVAGQVAETFSNGYLRVLASAQDLVHLDANSLRQPEAAAVFGSAPSGYQGIALPIREQGATHCLVTLVAPEVVEQHRMTLEAFKRQLETTCTRLVRLAAMGFPGAAGKQQQQSASSESGGPEVDGAKHNSSALVRRDSQSHPILALCAELYDQDSGSLQLKVINYLKSRIGCETGFLLLVSQDRAHVCCQVVGNSVLQEEVHIGLRLWCDCEIPEAHKNFFAVVIQNNKSYYLEDIPKEQLDDIVSVLGGSVDIRSLLCVPVTSRGVGQVVAIACMVNKTSAANFKQSDVDIIHECFRYTSTVLTSTIAFQTERMLKNQTQALLQVAQNIFRKLDDLTVLLREIMAEARNLTQAERCSVFLLDKETNELVAKVFDGLPTTSNEKEQPVEIRIPANHGIAGYVATKGEMLNIKDAYSHPLFYSKVDEDTGFRTRNILCFPIQDESGTIVGVAQLCNKINAAHFSNFDEDIARAFSVYCCISIIHSLMYKKVQAAQARHQLATELMTYHMHVPDRGIEELTSAPTKRMEDFCPNFDSFVSVPRHVADSDTCQAVMFMFDDLSLTKQYRIHRTTLARFVLLARKGYRDPPYHNWSHAFSVAHFTYLCLKNLRLENYLTPLEYFSFLVASLCHDIDHRGTNNSFENSSGSALSGLYSSEGSVLERHHFSQTVCILNREGCNVFENLSEKEYSAVLDIIRDIILATDLAHHLKIRKDIEAMVSQKKFDVHNQQHRYLLLCLLMTASDLSDQTKVWKNTRQVAKLIYQEFFSLGDKEKSLGKQPAEGMDRDKADIPQLQVNFLNIIAAPVYKAMEQIWPNECGVLCKQIERNISNWKTIRQKLENKEVEKTDRTIFEECLVSDDE